eukprot:PhF_6_TR24240/c0_g1_i1/m.33704
MDDDYDFDEAYVTRLKALKDYEIQRRLNKAASNTQEEDPLAARVQKLRGPPPVIPSDDNLMERFAKLKASSPSTTGVSIPVINTNSNHNSSNNGSRLLPAEDLFECEEFEVDNLVKQIMDDIASDN